MKKQFKIFALLVATALTVPAVASAEEGGWLKPVDNKLALAECSACHMVYPAGLLPQRSWKAIMGDLTNHYGEDASLDEAARKEIEDYLVANAADADGKKFRGVDADVTPLRITELPWFTQEHGKRARKRAQDNPKIGSISNCAGCHSGAAQGYFEDD